MTPLHLILKANLMPEWKYNGEIKGKMLTICVSISKVWCNYISSRHEVGRCSRA